MSNPTEYKIDSVLYCEANFPETTSMFKNLQKEQYKLFCQKQMDYGPSNIALGTQLKNDKEILASIRGIIIRANDKMQRLINLVIINDREPENESVTDTFMDLSVYATIAMTVKNGMWGK